MAQLYLIISYNYENVKSREKGEKRLLVTATYPSSPGSESSARTIISLKELCLSSEVVTSPVLIWSDTVRMARIP